MAKLRRTGREVSEVLRNVERELSKYETGLSSMSAVKLGGGNSSHQVA